jgi:hypothetical protein
MLFEAKGDKEYLPITVCDIFASSRATCAVLEISEHGLLVTEADRVALQGLGTFTKLAAELAYGKDSKPIVENRVITLVPTDSTSDFTPARHHAIHLWDWRPSHRHRLPRSLLPERKDDLLTFADMGESYPGFKGCGTRGEAVQVSGNTHGLGGEVIDSL